MHQDVFHPSLQQQCHPHPAPRGVAKRVAETPAWKKVGVGDDHFALRLRYRMQIRFLDIVAVTDVVPHQKCRALVAARLHCQFWLGAR